MTKGSNGGAKALPSYQHGAGGKGLRLARIDPGATPYSSGEKEADRATLDALAIELDALQNLFYADRRFKLLVVLQGLEGESVSWSLGGSYRIDFLMESAGSGDVVRLRNLVLSRVRRDEKGRETVHDVARTSVNLRVREPFVLGVGREEGGSAALFLVLSAAPVGPGPGIGGIR